MDKIYIQTYSVIRDYMQDFRGTMKRIAEVGYDGVEFAAGYGGLTPAELKTFLDDIGLKAISTHVGLDKALENIEFMTAVGAQYLICPSAHMPDKESTLAVARKLNEIGAQCKAAGLKFGYHNHTQEFNEFDGKYCLDILMENTDPESVIMELDVGWASCAGINVIDYINKHAGRVELIHAKECNNVVGVTPPVDWNEFPKDEKGWPILPDWFKEIEHAGQVANGPTGQGIFDWSELKKTADAQGTKAYIVEREYDYQGDIWKCIAEDLAYLRTI
ncbi:MAG: sugar phosphate isomerase/epimerase [Firmicutes bacterium]|nr:sugar phosphate isomerase/epimerase [Bacillota bacterium]